MKFIQIGTGYGGIWALDEDGQVWVFAGWDHPDKHGRTLGYNWKKLPMKRENG